MNLTLIVSLAAAAAGFAGAWNLQAHQITKLELNHATERIAIQRANRATLERVAGQIAQAQTNATVRVQSIRRDAAAVGSAGNGLRLTTAATVRTASSDPAACPESTSALASVFDQCVGELQALAERADGHVSDIQTLTESWPK